jgi:leader peptidase (prepilin peptidase)/N-methyltransferase
VEEAIFRRQPPPEHPQRALDRLSLPMNIWFRFSESLSAIFFFVLGACVGSFLNVVIYRLPHRISVLVKPSHCPGCKSEISFRDNRPVLGWLKLQGRCRDCNVSIPMRYPTIELLIGLVFLLLFFVELISGGTNLPARTPKHAGVLWILFYTKWDLVGLYLYHCFLFCTLFSWVMIGFDGHRLPRLFVVLTIVFFAGLQFCFPGLQLLQGHLPISGWSPDIPSTIALTCGLGLAGGLIAGLIADRLQARSNSEAAFRLLPAWMLLGVALGWQAVVGVFVLLLVWRTLSVVHRAFLEDGSAYEFVPARLDLAVPVFFLLHHCVWRLIWLAFLETPTGT